MLNLPPRSDFRTRPIFTPRLMLAPLDGAAAREMHEAIALSRAELEPWLPWVPFTQDAASALQYAEASAHDWDSGRASRFVIRDRVTHVFLGIAGIEAWQSLHDAGDLGYWLTSGSHGKGYMTEAARATLHFAFETAGAMRHGLDEPIPGAPAISDEGDAAVAISQLIEALQRFDAHDGPLQPHFAYGLLDKQRYLGAHAMHLRNHLSEIRIASA